MARIPIVHSLAAPMMCCLQAEGAIFSSHSHQTRTPWGVLVEDGGGDGGVDRVSYDHPLLSTILDLAIPQIACPGYERCFHRHWEAEDEVDHSQVLK